MNYSILFVLFCHEKSNLHKPIVTVPTPEFELFKSLRLAFDRRLFSENKIKILKFIKKLKVQLTFKIKLNNKSIVDLLLYKKDPLRGSISLT